jgi:peptidoglycan hydrolase-like protein with peptidoglycan-binding domain
MNIALSLIPLLMQELPGVISAWNSTSVNDHFSTYLNNLAPVVGKFIADVGAQLFPTAAPSMQIIGGALMAFNTDYTKMLQGQINNLIGPLNLGIQPLAVDGIYGQHTRDAVTAVQKHFGITLDGVAGNVTQGWIAGALAKLPQVA